MCSEDVQKEFLGFGFDEETSISRLTDLRRSDSPRPYIDVCERLCIREGIFFNRLRSVVWKDIVLGLGATSAVPYLAQRASSAMDPANRDDSATVTQDDSSSCATSCHRSRAPRLSSISVSCSDNRAPNLLRRCASMPGLSPPLRVRRSKFVRRRSASEGLKTSLVNRHSSSSSLKMNDRTNGVPFFVLPSNCQVRVVDTDIKRSLWLLYPQEEQRNTMRRALKKIVLRILASNPDRHYYQGLHELIGFVMYVLSPYLDPEEVISTCEGMLLTRWRSFSEKKLLYSEALLYAMHAVIAEKEPYLAMALEKCGVGPESHYAVSWVITWYVHCLKNVHILERLFDYFVTDVEGLAVVFFTATLVMSQRKRILSWIDEAHEEAVSEGFGEVDNIILMSKIYTKLVKMPSDVLDSVSLRELNSLILSANELKSNFLNVVYREQSNFLKGKICKLGFLANQRTRNAALRLLWYLLPREWRNPVVKRSVVKMMLVIGTVVAMLSAILCKYTVKDAKTPP